MKKSNALLLMLLPAFALTSCGVGDYAANYKAVKTALDQVKTHTDAITETTGYARNFASVASADIFYTIPTSTTDKEGNPVTKVAKVTNNVDIKVENGTFKIDNGIYQGSAKINFKKYFKDTASKPEEETPEGEEPAKPGAAVKKEGSLTITATYYVEGLNTIVAFDGVLNNGEEKAFKVYSSLPLDLNAAVKSTYKDETTKFLDFLPAPEASAEAPKKAAEEPSTPSLAIKTENMIRYLKLANKETGKEVDFSFELASKQRPLVPSDTNDITVKYDASYKNGLVTKFNTKTDKVIIKNSPSEDKKVNAHFVENVKVTYSAVSEPLEKLDLTTYTESSEVTLEKATTVLNYFSTGLTSYFASLETTL